MTLASDILAIAGEIALCAPEQAERLWACAVRVRRIEYALDELVQDARESAELAEQSAGVVVQFRGRMQ